MQESPSIVFDLRCEIGNLLSYLVGMHQSDTAHVDLSLSEHAEKRLRPGIEITGIDFLPRSYWLELGFDFISLIH